MQETRELDRAFRELEAFFNGLPSSSKRCHLSDDRCTSMPPQSSFESPPPIPSSSSACAIGLGDSGVRSEDETNVVMFHTSADHVLAILSRLQNLVKLKQALLHAESGKYLFMFS